MRLIDADKLKKAMDRYWGTCQRIRKPRNGETAVFLDVRATVEKQPTIDAEPVRHGKWIIRDNPGTGWYRVTCSECGEDVTSTAPCIGFFPNAKVTWNYCPECGARMDEE